MIKDAIAKAIKGENLTEADAKGAMDAIMSGEATPAQIGAFLVAMRIKGETVDEIAGCARTMREKATRVTAPQEHLVDTCGTGGDSSGTFNISTVSAFVVAGAGATVAKHGNRAASSKCGSADVLKELGVNIEAPVEVVERCLAEVGIGFLYAPLLHGAMKHAIGPRREIGQRTIFNFLGPLTNPAGARRQVMGVFAEELVAPLAEVLGRLGAERALVVRGLDGLDEITVTGETLVAEWDGDRVNTYRVKPEDFGVPRAEASDLLGGELADNARIAMEVLSGEAGPRRDIVLLNAGAAIAAAGLADAIADGVALAAESIDSGAAMEKLRRLREVSAA